MAFGDVIQQYPYLDVGPRAIAFDGKNLWVGLQGTNGLQTVDPGTGEIIAETILPFTPYDMTFDGKYLYISESGVAVHIYDLDVNEVDQFPYVCLGLTTDGNKLYIVSGTDIHYVEKTGEFIRSLGIARNMYSLGFDGKDLYYSFQDRIIKLNIVNGGVIQTVLTPPGQTRLIGLCFDGKNLWGAGTTPDNIYCFSLN